VLQPKDCSSKGPKETSHKGLDADESLADSALDQIKVWTPDDDEPPKFPRYQIHIVLAHANAIP